MRPFQFEVRHFVRLDALDAAADTRNQDGKGLKALLHW